MPIKEAQDASCASLACPRKGNAGCGGWHKDNTAFPAWGRQREGGLAAKKEANPASLRSAAPSKGRGSCGHSLLPMEGGAPKGRSLDGESGMKKSEGDRLKYAVYESTREPLTRPPFPKGEGKEEAAWPQKRKPTPPRCARQPLPREGARVDTPSFLWKEVPRRGGGWMGKAVSPTQRLPRGRRGAVSISHSQISIYP